MKFEKEDVKRLAFSILICILPGIFGSIATYPSIPTWYASLIKPSFSPSNWIFGPVWTVLYILMGISLYLIWRKGFKKSKEAIYIFIVQLILNTCWSFLFFGMRNPFYGFVEIIFLWLAIAYTIIKFYRIDKNAAYLLIPYILWVSFASFLNYSIWMLNV